MTLLFLKPHARCITIYYFLGFVYIVMHIFCLAFSLVNIFIELYETFAFLAYFDIYQS